MTATLMLTAAQILEHQPVLGLHGTRVLVAAIHPNGSGWELHVHSMPGDRRDAIRAACGGQLKLPRHKHQFTPFL